MMSNSLWCISLNAWIRFSAEEHDLIQLQIARTDEVNSFLTTPWETLAPQADYLYCQKDDDKDVIVYCYHAEDNCLYRYDGINQLTKAPQVSIAQVSNNEFHWRATPKYPFDTSLIAKPESIVHSKPLSPETQKEQWQHLKDTHSQFLSAIDSEFNEEQCNELLASFFDVLHDFKLKSYDRYNTYLEALQQIIHNKDNPIHQLLAQQAARTVDYPSIDSAQAGAFLKKKHFFFTLLVNEYNLIGQQFKLPEIKYQEEKHIDISTYSPDTQKNFAFLDSLRTKLLDLQALTQNTEDALSFKEKELHSYATWVSTALSEIVKTPSSDATGSDKITTLKTFLKSNWELVKGTTLSPTAIPETLVTAVLCDIARGVALDQESVLQCLMPGLLLESISDDYPSLEEQTNLETVLKTHILSDDGLNLLPVRLLSELALLANIQTNDKQYNPYFDYAQQKPEAAKISGTEYERLFKHSEYTKALLELRKNHEALLQNSFNMLGQLTRLGHALELNSAHALGKEDNAATGAYPAIIAFNNYYQKLTAENKQQIPEAVKNAIELLLNLASDPTKNINATENLQTCIVTRRTELLNAMKGHEALLESITISEEKKNALLSKTQENYEFAQKILSNFLQAPNSYQGYDALRLNLTLLKTLGLSFRVQTADDLSLIQQFELEEMALVLKEEQVQEDIISQINTLENLVTYLLDLPLDKLTLFMKTMMANLILKRITSESKLNSLTMALTEEKQKVIKSLVQYNWGIQELFGDSEHLSSLQYCLNFPESHALFLEQITEEQRAALLQKQTHQGYNALMLAIIYTPEAVAPLLKYTPKETLETILSQKKTNGWNALMFAVRYHPELVATILEYTPKEALKAILSQADTYGRNAIMIAALYHPKVVATILECIPQETRETILSQIDLFQYNAFMIAVRAHPELIAIILKDIPPKIQQTLLSQTTIAGYNALMLAAQTHPETVVTLLKYTHPDVRETILSQTSTIGENALIVAARHHPKTVATILEYTPQEARKTILSQSIWMNDENAIMTAAQYHPESVATILAYIPQDARETILNPKNYFNRTPIRLAKEYNSETRDITQCDAKTKAKITALLEIQILWELTQLTKKIALFEKLPNAAKDNSRFTVATKLGNELNTQFQHYLDSPKNHQVIQALLNGFSSALADEKNEILFQHRNPVMRFLQNIVHFICRLLSLHSSHGQGFFKTDTAKKINTLKELITQHSRANSDMPNDFETQLNQPIAG